MAILVLCTSTFPHSTLIIILTTTIKGASTQGKGMQLPYGLLEGKMLVVTKNRSRLACHGLSLWCISQPHGWILWLGFSRFGTRIFVYDQELELKGGTLKFSREGWIQRMLYFLLIFEARCAELGLVVLLLVTVEVLTKLPSELAIFVSVLRYGADRSLSKGGT